MVVIPEELYLSLKKMQDQGNVQQLTVANKDNSSEERLPAKPLKHHELTPSNIMSPRCKTEKIKHPIS